MKRLFFFFKKSKPEPPKLDENEIMAKMLTALVDLGALTADEAQTTAFTGELPNVDIIQRIKDRYEDKEE